MIFQDKIVSFLVVALVAFAATASESPFRISVEPDVAIGPVKPVNGVGQPPMVGALAKWPMMHYLKEAGIPYSRLHDVGGRLGGGLFVDIPNLFPDFDADENDPKNYRFAYTDSLMKALEANGVEPFFRLGVTIENWVNCGLPASMTPAAIRDSFLRSSTRLRRNRTKRIGRSWRSTNFASAVRPCACRLRTAT